MEKSAKLVLTSYDNPKIMGAILKIKKNTSQMNITLGKPVTQKVKMSKGDPQIWGCKGDDLKRKSIPLHGSIEDLEKITTIKIPNGVYLQLLLE